MSARIAWMSASRAAVENARRGEEIGEDEVTEDGAVCIANGSDVFVIEGSVEEIRAFAERVDKAAVAVGQMTAWGRPC